MSSKGKYDNDKFTLKFQYKRAIFGFKLDLPESFRDLHLFLVYLSFLLFAKYIEPEGSFVKRGKIFKNCLCFSVKMMWKDLSSEQTTYIRKSHRANINRVKIRELFVINS